MSEPTLTPILAERLPALDGLPPLGTGPPDPAAIAKFEAFAAPVDGYTAPSVEVTDGAVPGPHGDVPVRIYRPEGTTPRRGLVWAHGGAFVAGDLDMPESDVVARELAANASVLVVTVDYRLCLGGVHFPVPHDDVHAAFVWSAGPSGPLADRSNWALGGASAGGNLAAGVAQRLRDEGGPAPDALVLAYPVVHYDLPAPPEELQARIDSLPGPLRFPPSARTWINGNFLGEHAPDAAYAFAGLGDVAGLPPVLVTVGDHDDLTPSGQEFVRQISEAGGRAELELVAGVPHGHLNVPGLPEALGSIDRIASFLAEAAA